MYRKLVDLWNNELVKQCWERIPNSEIFSSELCTKIQYFAHSAIFHYNTSRTGTSRTFDFPLLYKIVGFFVTHRHGLRQIDTFLNSSVLTFTSLKFKYCEKASWKKSSMECTYYYCQNKEEYFFKFLWPYKNIWTL